jgi:hypothetical protein
MAKAPQRADNTESLLPEPVTETITYVPGNGDPTSIKWCGHTFHANVPKEITGHASGAERDRLNMHLIERARENKSFQVGNARPKRDVITEPKTAEEYRAYVVGWLKETPFAHADDLIRRFAKDRELQAACEVGSDDFSWIATLFMPKLHELARADELTQAQVSSLWIQNGFNVLPW